MGNESNLGFDRCIKTVAFVQTKRWCPALPLTFYVKSLLSHRDDQLTWRFHPICSFQSRTFYLDLQITPRLLADQRRRRDSERGTQDRRGSGLFSGSRKFKANYGLKITRALPSNPGSSLTPSTSSSDRTLLRKPSLSAFGCKINQPTEHLVLRK